MSGELKIQLKDGTNYWFGRDDRFPDEVRIYGSDTRHWKYVPTGDAQQLVHHGLHQDADVQQRYPIRIYQPYEGDAAA